MLHIGGKITFAIAEAITACIRDGRPLPIIVGALVGACVGAAGGLITIYLLGPLMLIGAVAGATVGASLFKKPVRALVDQESAHQEAGRVCKYWTYQDANFRSITVLMERAIYVARDDKASWTHVLGRLEQGADPALPLGDLVWLDQFAGVEVAKREETEVILVYRRKDRVRRRPLQFPTKQHRDDFFTVLEQQLGGRLERRDCCFDPARATRVPLILLLLAILAVAGVAYLAGYWTAFPPPPPFGQAEQDSLVRTLVSAGPIGVVLAGTIPCLLIAAWLVLRFVRPPRFQYLTRAASESPDHQTSGNAPAR